MAVTIVKTSELMHKALYLITVTADGDADLTLPDRTVAGITFQSDGTDGGGTLTVLVSNDGVNFVAAGFATSADPRNLTAVASVTAAGAWLIPAELLSFRTFRFHLTGSTSPVLLLNVAVEYMN